ncbi:MAG: phosphoribosylformylglycinamidine synthase subunit PurS [Acidobacteriota bacterium]|jgi:phosphoribosylformylglycinamidine synthase
MKARVTVRLKPSVLDPQGMTIQKALVSLGYDEVSGVRQGKVFDLEVSGTDAAAARARLEEMGRRLLSNPVVEDFSIEVPAE